jgi:hypothetical protein
MTTRGNRRRTRDRQPINAPWDPIYNQAFPEREVDELAKEMYDRIMPCAAMVRTGVLMGAVTSLWLNLITECYEPAVMGDPEPFIELSRAMFVALEKRVDKKQRGSAVWKPQSDG